MKEILYYLTTTDDPDYLFCPYTEQELANMSGTTSVSEVDEEEFMEYIRSFGHTYGVKPEFCTKENNYTEKITVAMLNQTEIEKLSRNIMQRIQQRVEKARTSLKYLDLKDVRDISQTLCHISYLIYPRYKTYFVISTDRYTIDGNEVELIEFLAREKPQVLFITQLFECDFS